MKHDFPFYLIEALREDLAACEASQESLRSSLRYRVGGWILEAFPPRITTFVAFLRLLRFVFRRSFSRPSKPSVQNTLALDAAARSAAVIVFGRAIPDDFLLERAWKTENPDTLARCLDMTADAKVLIVRSPKQQVLRRLTRARRMGWRVVWDPEDGAETHPALIAYARAHADEFREGNRA